MIWKVLLFALIGYVTVLLIVYLLQRQLLYLPDGFRLSEVRAFEEGLRHWPSSEHFRGFTAYQELADAQGTVIGGKPVLQLHPGCGVPPLAGQDEPVESLLWQTLPSSVSAGWPVD
jgi:hypothetical protein